MATASAFKSRAKIGSPGRARTCDFLITAAFPSKLRRTQKSYDREPRMTVGETLGFHYKTVTVV